MEKRGILWGMPLFCYESAPQKGAKQPPPFDMFPPPDTVPPVLGGIYINVVTGGRNDRKLVEVVNCPSCAVPLRLY